MLCAYTGLVFACLCLGFYLVPRHYWSEDDFGLHAVTWFVVAGVIGVVAFAAPGLVRGEFGTKDDQFVRRLPGALPPAFGGKLLFLGLATLLLPLLGLLIGEGFVLAVGGNWNWLVRWSWNGEVWWNVPSLALWCGLALCCAPWVWAIGTWLPGGRMALLGTVLFGLLLGVSVFAVLRQSPGLAKTLAWLSWWWAAPPAGLIVAAWSWRKGRRGGGPLRSARFGLLATAVLASPLACWLGAAAWRDHHPDLQQLVHLRVDGISPSGRFLLAEGKEDESFLCVPLRIDLATGAAQQVGGVGTCIHWEARPTPWNRNVAQRHWWCLEGADEGSLIDLETGATDVPCDEGTLAQIAAERRATSLLRAPGGVVVAIDDGAVARIWPDGECLREDRPLPSTFSMRAAGHGVRWLDGHFYGFARGEVFELDRAHEAFFVGELLLFRDYFGTGWRPWKLRGADGETRDCQALLACDVLGLFDDQRVLVCKESRRSGGSPRLFLFDPANGSEQEIALPVGWPSNGVSAITPLRRRGSLVERDPEGRTWLDCSHGAERIWRRLDPQRLALEAPLPIPSILGPDLRLLSWHDWPKVLVQHDAEIVHLDVHTGAREVLFPRR